MLWPLDGSSPQTALLSAHIAPGFARITALACLALASPAAADRLPKWEAGAGLSLLDFPDYRGADERSTLVLPFPYLIYRGEVLRLDREGLRGLLVESDRVELDVSANASIPVDSEDNATRGGMPDLDAALEIGPSLNLTLYGHRSRRVEVQLKLPLRAVIATDLSHARAQGLVFEPRLNVDIRARRAGVGWRGGAAIGPVFVSNEYASYFYSVAPAYATAARPAYQAEGGYAGTQVTLSLTWRGRSLWAGAFLRQDWLAGASFVDSPLVRQKQALAVGVGVAWVFARSQTLVEAYD
jgi:outer membrane scaffolding protein for murein synthesis (MipA/OmpV family)